MRQKYVLANWKMNLLRSEAIKLLADYQTALGSNSIHSVVVGVAPSFPWLLEVARAFESRAGVWMGSQDVSPYQSGAYTGDTSAAMLRSGGCRFVLVGHSERRIHYQEGDRVLTEKVNRVLEQELHVVLCVGEDQSQRESGTAHEAVLNQLQILSTLPEEVAHLVIIAYEPVWAIGTGLVPQLEDIQDMHAYIRSQIASLCSKDVSTAMPILYGGSVKPINAKAIGSLPDVDGVLVGGASLDANAFGDIVSQFAAN